MESLKLIKIKTSESALDDLKVRNVVQEVRCPWRIWIMVLRRVSVVVSSAVVYTGAICTVLPSLNGNELLNAVGSCVGVCKRGHI